MILVAKTNCLRKRRRIGGEESCMELTQLQYFQELARREHLTKTAEYLNITPPSLSVTISKLEHELGVKLFERSGRNIRLNENGKIFLDYVDQALETLEVGRRALAANIQADRNSIMLGVSAQTLWLDSIQAFLSRYPQVSISRKSLTLAQIEDRAYMAQFDFVLTGLSDLPSKEWEHCVLIPDDKPMLVLSKGHPWANRKEITLQETAAEPFVMLPKDYVSRRYADSLCEAAHVKPYIVAEGDYLLRAHLLHMEKRVVSITTNLGMSSLLLRDLDYIPIRTDAPRRTQALFWPKAKHFSVADQMFKEFMYQFSTSYASDQK